MKELFSKILLFKQQRCIDAIKYLNKKENIHIYNVGINYIKCHEEYLVMPFFISSLKEIRKFYHKDLKYRRSCLKKAKGEYLEELTKIINMDLAALDVLTDDFIKKFEELNYYVKYINDNKKYLTSEQEQEYLIEYYKLTNNNVEYDKLKVRSVN